ncbi:type III secretion system export apparatus subunit SctV [Salinicola avicenniae]|uniref:type III secretion system export apparatus subunit SctV n=1 Tax=Salinicola avicenniae TaxID=2916836 RepID=UPI0020735441|nr:MULTISPECIES: type III secretion system export apparatus subunit SctV [unclassified Salinicola]
MNLFLPRLLRLAGMVGRRAELLGAVVVLAVVFLIVAPVPTWLMDILIAVNICVACLMITLSLFLPKPLAFSTFPAVLLLTTMFRLALSIATTRLILLDQDGGNIIAAFGNFVVGGNLAVGLVMFLIITVVNFLVITKGSERVAEVSARFTLDGLPGKQMSIDSDLRANLISADDARRKRDRLTRESQLFGAMDGAMKFVKGDAIAGLVIVCINLVGGLAIGMTQYGMGMGEALAVYSVLSIGDGLIAQIPALLISLTAGMIITRVSQDEEGEKSNVGRDIVLQMSSEPRAWIIAAVGMLVFALLPGMPSLVFVTMGLLTGLGGYLQYRRRERRDSAGDAAEARPAPADNGMEDLRGFSLSRPYLIQLPARYAGHADASPLIQAIRRRRNSMISTYGLTLPAFDIECLASLPEDEFRFCIHEVAMFRATLSERVAVRRGPLPREPEDAIEGDERRQEQHLLWVAPGDPLLQEESVEPSGSEALIVQRMEDAMFHSASRFLGLQECKVVMTWLEAQLPELAQELQRTMPLTRFSGVLQRLVSERVPLRAIRLIAEALVEHGQHERDVAALSDYARIALKDQIFDHYQRDGALHVWLMTPETEELFRDALRQTQTGIFLQIENQHAQSLVEQLGQAFPASGPRTHVLLIAQDLRSPMRDLLQDEFNHVPVMSFAELGHAAKVEVAGRLDLIDDRLLAANAA